MALLCRRHHRAVHEGGIRICIDRTGQVVFFTPRGKALFDAPAVGGGLVAGGPIAGGPVAGRPTTGEPTAGTPIAKSPIEAREDAGEPLRRRGLGAGAHRKVRPCQGVGAARWKRDSDVPWAVEARAWEALDSG
jgi:hypothetical protein